MSTEKITIAGIVYVTDSALSFGDYGGSGSYGLANIEQIIEEHSESVCQTSFSCLHDCEVTDGRYLGKELVDEVRDNRPEVLDVYGDYSSRQVYLRADLEETPELMKSLEDYPCLDDERTSQVEMRWLDEAWSDWLKRDLIETLADDDLEDYADDYDDLFSIFWQAMEDCNEYPIAEYSNVYVRIEEISERFKELIIEAREREAYKLLSVAI